MDMPVSVEGVKAHLVGLESWLGAAAAQKQYTDTRISDHVIPAQIRKFERKTNYRITMRQIVNAPDGKYTGSVVLPGTVNPVNIPVLERDGMALRAGNVDEYFKIRLFEHPVIMVQRMRVMLNALSVYEIPTQWFNLEKRNGMLHLLPINGALLVSQVINLIQLQVGFGNVEYLPNCLQLDYVVGLPMGWQNDPEYADLGQSLEQYCALQVLNDVQEFADAGLISVGTGSEQRTYSRFKELREYLERDVKEFMEEWEGQESSPLLGFV